MGMLSLQITAISLVVVFPTKKPMTLIFYLVKPVKRFAMDNATGGLFCLVIRTNTSRLRRIERGVCEYMN